MSIFLPFYFRVFAPLCLALAPAAVRAADSDGSPGSQTAFFIAEYRVTGSTKLTELERGEAIYPFLGPGRTAADIEGARGALEKAYRLKGFETVQVEVPVATPRGGVVHLRVIEASVGRLRITGARFSLPSQITAHAPSLAPSNIPNFANVQSDILALNQWPDRRVAPALKAGSEPGTVDFDLNVEDKLPLHATLEVNNRRSANTTDLRLNGSVTYNNLWQRGHSAGASFQISPEAPDEVKVFTGFYTARFPELPGFSLLLQGTKQDSNVSTLGGSAVAGRGEILGARAIFNLPSGQAFSHSANIGFDYKHFNQTLNVGSNALGTPISYFPFTAGYSANWARSKSQSEFNAGVTLAFRGAGSDEVEYDTNRFKARGDFVYFRSDLAHTQELPGGAQLYGKVQGQAAGQPLLSSEQFAGGGLGTVRGYLEAEGLGDSAVFGTVELRSPSLFGWVHRKDTEWRIYGFAEGGILSSHAPLPEQASRFELASVGIGSRLQLFDYLRGSLDVGFPLRSLSSTEAGAVALTFRLWSEF